MFLVKTSVKNSAIEGLGVFADEDIGQGSHLWEYVAGFDLSFTPEQFDAMPPAGQDFLKRYAYFNDGCYELDGDNSKYTNHDERPNMKIVGDNGLFATRPIKKGEELTLDYRTFDENWQNKLADQDQAVAAE